jgi:hypothetical protein
LDPDCIIDFITALEDITGYASTPLLFVAGKLYPPDDLREALETKSLQRVLLGHDEDIEANRKLGNCWST